ncbi:MAG: hypothetical protein KAU17_12660 [Spirochaetales bacterium]|nr:hypothetical protein [Spirochaetales bacterium]
MLQYIKLFTVYTDYTTQNVMVVNSNWLSVTLKVHDQTFSPVFISRIPTLSGGIVFSLEDSNLAEKPAVEVNNPDTNPRFLEAILFSLDLNTEQIRSLMDLIGQQHPDTISIPNIDFMLMSQTIPYIDQKSLTDILLQSKE